VGAFFPISHATCFVVITITFKRSDWDAKKVNATERGPSIVQIPTSGIKVMKMTGVIGRGLKCTFRKLLLEKQ
jgi:hypothetical protein